MYSDFITPLLRRALRDAGNYRENIGDPIKEQITVTLSQFSYAYSLSNRALRKGGKTQSRSRVTSPPRRVRLITIPARQNDVTHFPCVCFLLANVFKLLRRTTAERFFFLVSFFHFARSRFCRASKYILDPSPPFRAPSFLPYFFLFALTKSLGVVMRSDIVNSLGDGRRRFPRLNSN